LSLRKTLKLTYIFTFYCFQLLSETTRLLVTFHFVCLGTELFASNAS